MKPQLNVNFDNAIIAIKILNKNTALVVDENTTIRSVALETFDLNSQLLVNSPHPQIDTKVIAFSSNAHYFATVTPDMKESKLYDTKQKKVVHTVTRHKGSVFCVAIDPRDKYMFSCGEDGLVFVIDIKSGQLAFTLPRHTDSVNDIAFSEDGYLVATGGYDRNVSLFSMATMTPLATLKAHSAPVIKIIFLDNSRVVSIDKKGGAIVWDTHSFAMISRLQGIHDDVTAVALSSDGRFLFIGSKLGYVMVFDAHSYDAISLKYIKLNHHITALSCDGSRSALLIGTQDGTLLHYEIFHKEQDIVNAIKAKEYAKIQPLVDANPLLAYTKSFAFYQKIWDTTYTKAKLLLENQDKQKAMAIFADFKDMPSKNQLIKKLFALYEEFDKFAAYMSQKKFALGYAMLKTNPIYKESKIFETVENEWMKTVNLAQKTLQNPNMETKANELLAPYRGVTEKMPIIQDLFLNAKILTAFKTAISHKNFKLAFEYVKKHQFLLSSNEYATLMAYSDAVYIKAIGFQNEGDTHSAIKAFNALLEFDDFKVEAKQTIAKLEARQKFFDAINSKDCTMAYELLDSSEQLFATEDGKRLQQQWDTDYAIASIYASSADANGIKTTLLKYLKARTRFMPAATVFSWCYITQLENAMLEASDKKRIENGIKKYILYFGVTEAIIEFFDSFILKYRDSKLVLDSQQKGSLENWRPSMIVESILD